MNRADHFTRPGVITSLLMIFGFLWTAPRADAQRLEPSRFGSQSVDARAPFIVQSETAPKASPARMFVGSAVGTAAGMWLGWRVGKRNEDGAAPFLAVGMGTLGSYAGARLARGNTVAPRNSAIAQGSVTGILAGVALGLVTAGVFDRINPELPQEGWVVGFSLGQAALATWIATTPK
jgi:hypothetical protein